MTNSVLFVITLRCWINIKSWHNVWLWDWIGIYPQRIHSWSRRVFLYWSGVRQAYFIYSQVLYWKICFKSFWLKAMVSVYSLEEGLWNFITTEVGENKSCFIFKEFTPFHFVRLNTIVIWCHSHFVMSANFTADVPCLLNTNVDRGHFLRKSILIWSQVPYLVVKVETAFHFICICDTGFL